MEHIETFIKEQNDYLKNHLRAKIETALKRVQEKISKLKANSWLTVHASDRVLILTINEQELKDQEALDGCYVIRNDLKLKDATMYEIHDRYKDLAKVERNFRLCKSEQLEIRPIFVRKEDST